MANEHDKIRKQLEPVAERIIALGPEGVFALGREIDQLKAEILATPVAMRHMYSSRMAKLLDRFGGLPDELKHLTREH
jgi:hypothetical protein